MRTHPRCPRLAQARRGRRADGQDASAEKLKFVRPAPAELTAEDDDLGLRHPLENEAPVHVHHSRAVALDTDVDGCRIEDVDVADPTPSAVPVAALTAAEESRAPRVASPSVAWPGPAFLRLAQGRAHDLREHTVLWDPDSCRQAVCRGRSCTRGFFPPTFGGGRGRGRGACTC